MWTLMVTAILTIHYYNHRYLDPNYLVPNHPLSRDALSSGFLDFSRLRDPPSARPRGPWHNWSRQNTRDTLVAPPWRFTYGNRRSPSALPPRDAPSNGLPGLSWFRGPTPAWPRGSWQRVPPKPPRYPPSPHVTPLHSASLHFTPLHPLAICPATRPT